MVKFGILGTGSTANSYIFSNEIFSFVIDNGFSYKEFVNRCNQLNFDINSIKFILLTHTHTDHKKGVYSTAKRLDIPIFFHSGLDEKNISSKPIPKKFNFKWDIEYNYKNILKFIPFKIYHDVPYSSGFYFNFENINFSLITDTGKYDNKMLQYAINSDIIFLEANYDPKLLKYGPYPELIKKRIDSTNGHLSNYQSINFINDLIKHYIEYYSSISDKGKNVKNNKNSKNTNNLINNEILQNSRNIINNFSINKEIYLCHLSDTNNSVELVKNSFQNGIIKNYKNFNSLIEINTVNNLFRLNIKNSFINFTITIMPKNSKIKKILKDNTYKKL